MVWLVRAGHPLHRAGTDRQRLGLPQVHRLAGGAGPAGRHRQTHPPLPAQTNSKIERCNRTLAGKWAYIRPYTTKDERTAALADFLHPYNHHRGHTALDGRPPITRINNPAGYYTWAAALAGRGRAGC
ncbi:integrase core domain-containing protein [Actinomadura sp. PM05-2]|uniref:Integrase core domain-containing protein n=1 Tax=Actinomadura parmotrematis TaxID=2864039 RepID=A0ABS7G7X1_9ACTN|nr:integrase core domain-containing protein [Actinomadura parmotrematis]